MAYLAHAAVADIRQAAREGRSVIVVGPAKSGLTWLVNQNAAFANDPVVRISLRGVRDVQVVRAKIRSELCLSKVPERPSDFQLAVADLEQRPSLVVVNDCHRADPEGIAWLLEAALEPVAGGVRVAVPFVFEGAFDPDAQLNTTFPDGYSTRPLIHYVEPSFPWGVLAEVDEIVRGRWGPSFSQGLIPWIADVSCGDVGFVNEIRERLPNNGEVRDETLTAALRHVGTNGVRAREVRESVREVDDDALLRLAASGQGIPGVVPSALEPCALKRAYFAGIVVFDGLASAYRIRGPITAKIVAQATGANSDEVFEGQFILARLLTFFAHIAALELDLRSSLRPRDPKALASAVSTPTSLGTYRRPIKEAVIRSCSPTPHMLGALNEALNEILPDSKTVAEQIRERLKEEPTIDSTLDGATFSQLIQMARLAQIITGSDESVLKEINEYRNAFAHFRAEPYGRCERLLQMIAQARRTLEKIRP